MSSDKTMLLTSELIAKITDGRWFNLRTNLKFHGIRVNINRLKKGDICFTTNPEQWGSRILNTEGEIETIFNNGAKGVVVTNDKIPNNTNKPVLVVSNTKKALEDIAFYIRDNIDIPRVLVTGTEGKTGFKNQLHFLLSYQTNAHATLDSSNLNVPILCSMASISENDKVEILEASVAGPNVGSVRSKLVKPSICVITEVGFEHIASHGSFENMIKHKASIIDALQDDGICILNADSVNYDMVREAIYVKKYVDIKTFGSCKKCNAKLLDADFDSKNLLWKIKADIEGIKVSYKVPLLGEHVPISTLAPLLTIHYLGYDVKKAAKNFLKFQSIHTMGSLNEIVCSDKKFMFLDHSHRASILSYKSALHDLSRLSSQEGGRKIAVIGNMLNIGKISKQAHEDLAIMIENAKIEKLYTVGKFTRPIHDKLNDKSILIKHGDDYKEIESEILNDIQNGDLLFIKGHHRIWLKDLAQKIYSMGETNEIR